MKFKICTKCKRELPNTTEYFYVQRNGKFGLRADCKECCNKYQKEYDKKNREEIREYQKEYFKTKKAKNQEEKQVKNITIRIKYLVL